MDNTMMRLVEYIDLTGLDVLIPHSASTSTRIRTPLAKNNKNKNNDECEWDICIQDFLIE